MMLNSAKHKFNPRILLLGVLLLAILSGLSQLQISTASTQTASAMLPDKAVNTLPMARPQLQFTPAYTIYMPIQIYNGPISQPTPSPTASNTPTSTPTNTPTNTPPPGSGFVCKASGGSDGRSPGTYETTIAGVDVALIVGEGYDPDTPTHLGYLLHGDGGGKNVARYLRSSSQLRQFVDDNSWIFVAPISPNDGASWWNNWSGNHNNQLAALLDRLFEQYNLCQNAVFATTGSGGSEFWTSQFFPEKGSEHPAHALIACGGNDTNGNNSRRDNVYDYGDMPDVVNRTTLAFLYGTTDRLVPYIEESIDLYTDAGFTVTSEVYQGGGHCNEWDDEGFPSWESKTVSYWTDFLQDLE